MRKSIGIFFFAAFADLVSTPLVAQVIRPIGLTPGSQYQLIFVTADTIAGSFKTETPYNAFVNSEVALNPLLPSATWRAITSTGDGTDAHSNAPWLGLPVYNTRGIQVNQPSQSLYSGSAIQGSVDYNQFGLTPPTNLVWTGSTPVGTGLSGLIPLGTTSPIAGDATQLGTKWILSTQLAPSTQEPIYALSSAITVPVPEPATLTLLVVGLLVIGGRLLLRSRAGRR
jgi:hypothetical protein